MTKKTKKTKETTDLVPINPMESVEVLMNTKEYLPKDEKLIRFHLLRMFGVPIQSSAKIAGYSEQYGYNLVEKYKNQDKPRRTLERFVSTMPGDYKNLCKLRLPQIAQIEAKVLDEYALDPKLAIDKPQMLKHIKQSSGALDVDGAVKVNYNVLALNARDMMRQISNPDYDADAVVVSDSGDSDD